MESISVELHPFGPYSSLAQFCENFSLDEKHVLSIYVYGSRVYGTASESSDWGNQFCLFNFYEDFITVISEDREQEQRPGKDGNDITVFGEKQFQLSLVNHQQNALECMFLPKDKILLEKRIFQVKLDLLVLRHSFSKLVLSAFLISLMDQVANSWSKASKKLTIEKDLKRAKKGLFHSMRILMFGIQVKFFQNLIHQIAQHGRITDYSEANYLWDEIKQINSMQWQEYFSRYKKKWNSLKSEFRKVAPLLVEEEET